MRSKFVRLFNPRGRANRVEFITMWFVGSTFVVFLHSQMFGSSFFNHSLWGIAPVVLYFVTIYLISASTIRRLHDLKRSGWCFLLFLIPVIGLLFFYTSSSPLRNDTPGIGVNTEISVNKRSESRFFRSRLWATPIGEHFIVAR